MNKSFFIILFSILPFPAFTQTINLRTIISLPAQLKENSGLIITGANFLWTHNDSGNDASIFRFDTLRNITRSVSITNATNIDWEDVAKDKNGNLYIGDFGNNDNKRKDLRIYKISNPDVFEGNSLNAEIISFHYSNQLDFPPPSHHMNFDMEAMIYFNDSLYLFSKNSTEPFNGYTYLYRLPAKTGTYTASLIDSFYVGQDQLTGQITAADISPDKKKLVLLTYAGVLIFENFKGADFFKGSVSRYAFPEITQKEAICFVNPCGLYITDEEFLSTDKNLYYLEICQVTTGFHEPLSHLDIQLQTPYPNPSYGLLTFSYQLPAYITSGEIIIQNMYGNTLMHIPVSNKEESLLFETSWLPAGMFTCVLQTSAGDSQRRKFVVL